MKKVLPYILITVILLANFLAPVSVGWGERGVSMRVNISEAADIELSVNKIATTDTTIIVDDIVVKWDTENIFTKEYVGVILKDSSGNKITEKEVTLTETNIMGNTQTGSMVVFDNLTPQTTYQIYSYAIQSGLKLGDIINPDIKNTGEPTPNPKIVTTNPSEETNLVSQGSQTAFSNSDIMPECSILPSFKIGGCIAQGIYYLLFIPTSYLFALAGTFFDWTFNYSVQSSSYDSQFVIQGWGIVRDFCNMFFIFILLYISFKTILDLGASKTKEMIINVIIIGLLINFSLFVTQIVIDTSNILARVFYNSNTIQITTVENDGNASDLIKKSNETGIIPLSAALVNKVNPQSIIINAKEIGKIPDKAGQTNTDTEKNGVTTGTFIIVTLLASGINIVGFIIFLTVALIFVVRVVGLWIAMILAPLAFFSYTVPEMQNWGMVGWKNWWPETLKLAFLAPIFIFFIYLILQFLEVGLGALDAEGKGALGFIISIIMPFAFIMVLLMQAKKIAVRLSGQMGEGVAKLGSTVGGLALGAGIGAGAMAMRGTIGSLGKSLGEAKWTKKTGAFGRGAGNLGKWTSSKTFDIRNTKLGAEAGKKLETDLGKAKTGGYAKYYDDKVKKKQEIAKGLEVSENENFKQALNKTEGDLQKLLNANKKALDELDLDIEIKRKELADVTSVHGGGSKEAKDVGRELENAKRKKKALREGKLYEGDITTKKVESTKQIETGLIDASGNKIMREEKYTEEVEGVDEATAHDYSKDPNLALGVNEKGERRTIQYLEYTELKKRKEAIEKENRERKNKYASGREWWGGRINKEAAHKIRMETKIDSGTKV